jgi:hypothetical protein
LRFVANIAEKRSLCVVVAEIRAKHTAVISAGVTISVWLIEKARVNTAKVKKAKKKIKLMKEGVGRSFGSKKAWLIGLQHQVALGVEYYLPAATATNLILILTLMLMWIWKLMYTGRIFRLKQESVARVAATFAARLEQ